MLSKVYQSIPLLLGSAVIGGCLYGVSIYLTILSQANPGMPWRLGSYILAGAMILFLMRRGWKILPSIILGIACLVVLNMTRASLGGVDRANMPEQSQDKASAFSGRMEDVQSEIDAIGFNRILRPEQMLSADSLADSQRRLVKFATLIKKRDALVRQYFEVNEGSQEATKSEPSKGNAIEKWNNLSKAQLDAIAMSRDILDFVSSNLKNATLSNGEIFFKTPDQMQRYKELTNRMNELKKIEIESWKAIDCLSGKSRLCS